MFAVAAAMADIEHARDQLNLSAAQSQLNFAQANLAAAGDAAATKAAILSA